MGEHTPNSAGRGKYSKIISGLYESLAVIEKQCDRALAERDAKIDALVKALEFIRDGYDNHDVNHVDYRVKVYEIAREALSRVTADVGTAGEPS